MKITKKYIRRLVKEEVDPKRGHFMSKEEAAQQRAEERAYKDGVIAEIVDLMRKRMQTKEVEGVLEILQRDYPSWVGSGM